MKAESVDQFYNGGTGIRTSIKELAELILDITQSDLNVHYEPAGVTFVKNRIGCPEKAHKEINFKASISLVEGIKKLVEWRKSHIEEVASRRQKVA